MTRLGWSWAGFVWGYALLWFLVNDRVKLLAYRIFDPVKASLLAKKPLDLTPQIAKRAYELYEQQGRKSGSSIQNWDQAEREIRQGETVPKPTVKVEPKPEVKVEPKPEAFFIDIADFVRTQEEPTVSTGPYAQFKTMQMAHKYVTVVLDGQGSDEMMAGYLPYHFVYLRQLKKNKQYKKLLKEIYYSSDILVKYSALKFKRLLGLKKDVMANSLLKQSFITDFQAEKFNVTQDNLKKRLIEDIFHNSLQSLLRYEDRNAMRFSIEGRVPFLDFNLLRFLFTLPDEAIIKNGWNKFILRNAVKDLLPDMITNRRNKIGFTTPEYEWFMRMKNKIYAIFTSNSFSMSSLLRTCTLRSRLFTSA